MAIVFHETAVLIPAYQPDGTLFELVSRLEKLGFRHQLIVDDGSVAPESREIFERAEKLDSVTLLRHLRNMGKGASLKTGFEYILNELPFCRCAVTADADGQHHPEDILRVAEEARNHPGSLVLGMRSMNHPDVPFRSRFGNRLASFLMRFFRGVRLCDTQTGLRALPVKLIPFLFSASGTGYDFELQMLLTAKKHEIPFREIPIRTLYFPPGKRGSHFRPFRDSLNVCTAIFRTGSVESESGSERNSRK